MKGRMLQFTTTLTVACAGILFVVQAQASMVSVDAGVVYEDVGFISGYEQVSESFQITRAGTYRATLTDFEFPVAFDFLNLNIVSSIKEFGRVSAEGSFIFEADPGTYYANLLGLSGGDLELGLYGVQVALIDGFDSVSPVPLPAPVVLLASALIMIFTFFRRTSRVMKRSDDVTLVPA